MRLLAGTDGPGRRAVPAGELLHPVPLLAILVLLVNDWVLKGSAVPVLVTGKLSDVAGLLAAPLIATSVLDCALWGAARLGAPVDFSLRRGRLTVAAACIAGLFTAIKLSPPAGDLVERAAALVQLRWRIAPDPSDLVALPAVAIAVWLGRREIARVPLGRIEALERLWRGGRLRQPGAMRGALADVSHCGGDPRAAVALADALERHFAGGPSEPVWDELRTLRRIRHTRP